MKWSLKIGRIAGISVYVHATFLILVIWLAVNQYLESRSTAAMLGTVGFVLLLFLIIVLHELGHALAARRYGIETQDITLLPIGGVARLNRIPEDPRQELVVAIAGPLVNMVIAAGLFIGILISGGPGRVLDIGNLLSQLLVLNVWLAFFNLLPAFPMDGGRVLRALLALRLSRVRATELAVGVGHLMALVFGAAGLFGLRPLFDSNPFLVFIALFIWVGADAELQQVRMQAVFHGVRVREVMAREFDSFSGGALLEDVARTLVPGFQGDFPVMEDGRLVGFISVDGVAKGISVGGPKAPAGDYAEREFAVARPDDWLEDVLNSWKPGISQVVAVIDGGRLVGIVTPANIGEHLMIRSALSRKQKGSQL